MAYPERYVEQIITSLADPINEHLKLVGFEFSPELRQHFRHKLDTWLDKLQRLRMKPNNRTGIAKFYYDLLFDYPFGGVEVRNTLSLMDLISRHYQSIRPAKNPEEGCGIFMLRSPDASVPAKRCSTCSPARQLNAENADRRLSPDCASGTTSAERAAAAAAIPSTPVISVLPSAHRSLHQNRRGLLDAASLDRPLHRVQTRTSPARPRSVCSPRSRSPPTHAAIA
jgi:hypothetical protein